MDHEREPESQTGTVRRLLICQPCWIWFDSAGQHETCVAEGPHHGRRIYAQFGPEADFVVADHDGGDEGTFTVLRCDTCSRLGPHRVRPAHVIGCAP